MDAPYYFPGVTLLITHYNRSSSLERLLSTFQKLNCRFEDIVVSDDCSKPENLERVKEMQPRYHFRLITTPVNKGHGHSINKGQDVITTPYTLYVQEDFVPARAFPGHFKDALQFMNEDSTLDYIRFWALADKYSDLKPYGKGYSEMIYRFWNMGHLKFYQYSDTPHLRRSTFFQKFGRYKEGLKGDTIDYLMAISFLHNKGRGLFYDEFDKLFGHENSPDEPSTMRPLLHWRQKRNIFILFLRFFYLRYKWLKGTWLVKFWKN
jgi:glycosyltransferase involved in cell wall biosynthesis